MFDQTLSNCIVYLMISLKYIQKLHKRANMLKWRLGRFEFSHNYFEMKLVQIIELRRDI